MPDRFELCLAEVLRHEGGYVDHPSDPGGATNLGITRETLAAWRKIEPWTALPKSAVQSLTRAEAAKIYRANYWEAVGAGDLPPGLDLAVFDFAVNSGPARAAKTLQFILGVPADGVVGPKTLAAIANHPPATLVTAVCDARETFLRQLPTWPTFSRGWTARIAAIRATSLAQSQPRSTPMPNLSGYRTYIVAAFMLLAGLAQILGIDLPTLDTSSAGQLVLESLAILFLRKGLKSDVGNG